MPVKKLTHEEIDRRVYEAMQPPVQGGQQTPALWQELLNRWRKAMPEGMMSEGGS